MARIKKRRESKDKSLDSDNSSSKEDIKPKSRNSHVIQENLIACLLPSCPGSLQPAVGDSADEHSAPQYEHSASQHSAGEHSAPKYQHSAPQWGPGAEWCSSGLPVMYCTVHEQCSVGIQCIVHYHSTKRSSALQVSDVLDIKVQQSSVV